MQALIGRNSSHLAVLSEFSPRLLMQMGGGIASFAGLLEELGARTMAFSEGRNGHFKMRPVSPQELIAIGERLLELPFDDVGTNILLFFSAVAQTRFMRSLQEYKRRKFTA